jgi:hypothetical protein
MDSNEIRGFIIIIIIIISFILPQTFPANRDAILG